jgi:hypothetical protein
MDMYAANTANQAAMKRGGSAAFKPASDNIDRANNQQDPAGSSWVQPEGFEPPTF